MPNYILLPNGDFVSEDELYHWKTNKNHKYVAKVGEGRNARYFYSNAEYQAYLSKNKNGANKENIFPFLKNTATNTINNAMNKLFQSLNNAPEKINKAVNTGRKVMDKFYDDKNNMYDITSKSYNTKISNIAKSKEWQDIVARSDPEYVKKTSDGQTRYLIDDYAVKKKHPVLDIVDDIASGREVTVNKITKESAVAGLKDYAYGAVRTGALVVGLGAKLLTEKYKLAQGSYDDEIEYASGMAMRGAQYMKDTSYTVNNSYVSPISNTIKETNSASPRKIDQDKVVAAARDLMNSDATLTSISNVSGLSDEEIQALYVLLKNAR